MGWRLVSFDKELKDDEVARAECPQEQPQCGDGRGCSPDVVLNGLAEDVGTAEDAGGEVECQNE